MEDRKGFSRICSTVLPSFVLLIKNRKQDSGQWEVIYLWKEGYASTDSVWVWWRLWHDWHTLVTGHAVSLLLCWSGGSDTDGVNWFSAPCVYVCVCVCSAYKGGLCAACHALHINPINVVSWQPFALWSLKRPDFYVAFFFFSSFFIKPNRSVRLFALVVIIPCRLITSEGFLFSFVGSVWWRAFSFSFCDFCSTKHHKPYVSWRK